MRHFRYMTSGLDLKVARVGARVKAIELAAVMGVSSSRISVIEGMAVVTPRTVRRYRAALETCRNVTDGAEVA